MTLQDDLAAMHDGLRKSLAEKDAEIGRLHELAYAPDGRETRSLLFEEAAKRLPLQEEIGRLRTALEEIISISRRTPRRVLTEGEQPVPTSVALTQAERIARDALEQTGPDNLAPAPAGARQQ